MEPTIVGRGAELQQIVALLRTVERPPAALVVEGEPGIGKTALWEEALAAAEASAQVLTCRPAEAEAGLSFAGLGDLFIGVIDPVLDELPGPQRAAMGSALLIDAADGKHDHRVIGAATLSVLKALSSEERLVVAIDDLQWLDRPSARALGFALRRLTGAPVTLLATRRPEPTPTVLMLDAALRDRNVVRISIGPLSVGALERLMREHLGARFPRPVLLRIHDISRGNPLFALELARALAERDVHPEPGQPLPVPGDLRALLLARVGRLPIAVQRVLPFVALLAKPTERALAEALGDDWDDAIKRLAPTGLIEVDGGTVRFTHPLLAAAVADAATQRARADVHRRLSEIVEDEEQRARHLAYASIAPDAAVAATLETASRSATERGAPDAAAELADLAGSFTPVDAVADRCRRSILAGDSSFALGDFELAEARFREAEAVAPPGRDHADGLLHVGRMAIYRGAMQEAVRLIGSALDESATDPELRAAIETDLAFISSRTGSPDAILQHAQTAVDLAEQVGARHIRADALAQVASARFAAGEGLDRALLQEVLRDEDRHALHNARGRPSEVVALVLSWAGEFDEARAILDRCERETVEGGLDAMLPFVRYLMCEVDCWTGAWEQGLARAIEADHLAEQLGDGTLRTLTSYAVALLSAHLGRVDEARTSSKRGADIATSIGIPLSFAMNRSVFGFLEASLGRPDRAASILRPLVDFGRAAGMEEPAPMWFVPELIEALVVVGDLEKAATLTDWLEERGRAIDRPRGLAGAARCRALLAAAGGRTDEALAACDEALVQHDRVAVPFERARTLLVRGQVARRARKWGIARESLDAAIASFDELGAALWLERAQGERARIGGRTASRWELSESERQVAELVAQGKTNRAVAETLFLSPKTVSATLGRVYRKLGVNSRTELAARLANRR
jgi:DNA-binding CsgD family transcriptional regulator